MSEFQIRGSDLATKDFKQKIAKRTKVQVGPSTETSFLRLPRGSFAKAGHSEPIRVIRVIRGCLLFLRSCLFVSIGGLRSAKPFS